jgi:hypothetical protein
VTKSREIIAYVSDYKCTNPAEFQAADLKRETLSEDLGLDRSITH